ATWLLLLAVAAILTVNVLSAFENTLEAVVTLTLFIPLLIGTGGNAGAQSATTIVRRMAIDDIRPGDMVRVVLREGRVGLLLGTMLGGLSVAPVWIFTDPSLAVVSAPFVTTIVDATGLLVYFLIARAVLGI